MIASSAIALLAATRRGDEIVMVQPTVNFVLEDGDYHTPGDGPVVTCNFLLRLDAALASNHRPRSCPRSTCRGLPSVWCWALRTCGSSPAAARCGASPPSVS